MNMDKKIIYFVICWIVTLVCISTTFWAKVLTDEMCQRIEDGTFNCGKSIESLPDYLERIAAREYADVRREDEKKKQDFIDSNRDSLMNVYDKTHWEMKPAAKLTGKKLAPFRKADIGADMVTIPEWNQGDDLRETNGFMRHGIRYRNGRLVIPVDGTYFVYSNLDFFEECNNSTGIPNVQDINKPIKQSICKFNIFHDAVIELVSNVHPHSLCANSFYNSYSSYVSSIAELKAGDELSVKVSNITYLRYTKDNYFGVHLI